MTVAPATERALSLLGFLLVLLAIWSAHASAAFPGRNGQIAFVRGDLARFHGYDVDAVRLDGSHRHRLASGSCVGCGLSFSPSGGTIAFVGEHGLSVMNPDGSHVRTVVSSSRSQVGDDSGVAFSPDAARIAFNDQSGNVFVVKLDGSELRQLTHYSCVVCPGAAASGPRFSPDGRTIAFSLENHSGRVESAHVYLMNADGTHPRRLPNTAGGLQPDFSPNGRRIVFSSASASASGIHMMNVDGSHQRRLTRGAHCVDSDPVFAPDGRRIAFARGCSNGLASHIFTMHTDGTSAHQLSPGSSFQDFSPAWQPLR